MSLLKRDASFYQRDLDYLSHAKTDTAKYLSIMTGDSIDQCDAFVASELKEGHVKLRDPVVRFLETDDVTGDREECSTTFSKYLAQIKSRDLIMVPSLTAFVQKKEKQSLIAIEMRVNTERRSKYKKKKFEAVMNRDKQGENINQVLQASMKYLNNSMSGLSSIPTTALFHVSTHPALTSTCRNATSYANMHNEMFLMGNRPYFTTIDAIRHMLSILREQNIVEVEAALDQYGLVYPTADDVYQMVTKSLFKYTSAKQTLGELTAFIHGLTPAERAAICYHDDMHHLYKLNKEKVIAFLHALTVVPDTVEGDYHGAFKRADSSVKTCISFQHGELLRGRKQGDYLADTAIADLLDKHTVHFLSVLTQYESLIYTFFMNKSLPPNHAYMDYVRRECVLISDTDSTIFTTEPWIENVTGSLAFNENAFAVSSVMIFLTAKIVDHLLQLMSANLGVAKEDLETINMKNEFLFAVVMLPNKSKHYAAIRWGQEGMILPEPEIEIKGVNLRNSAWPAYIREDVERYITDIMMKLYRNEPLTEDDVFTRPLNIEAALVKKMKEGDSEIYTTVQVKSAESYAIADISPYLYYEMWRDVFAPKYGNCDAPPYEGIKVPVLLDTPRQLKAYLAGLEDRALAERFDAFLKRKGKKYVTNIVLPYLNILSTGIPDEIMQVLDKSKIFSGVNGAYYLVMTMLGYFIRDRDKTTCLYDLAQVNPVKETILLEDDEPVTKAKAPIKTVPAVDDDLPW